ncbi:unnamed protein product, partial [Ectocarpus fasciculatus]
MSAWLNQTAEKLDEDTHAVFSLVGHELVADRSGALYWPAQDTLVVADLHLEKGSS